MHYRLDLSKKPDTSAAIRYALARWEALCDSATMAALRRQQPRRARIAPRRELDARTILSRGRTRCDTKLNGLDPEAICARCSLPSPTNWFTASKSSCLSGLGRLRLEELGESVVNV
jgi:hypothetical protein